MTRSAGANKQGFIYLPYLYDRYIFTWKSVNSTTKLKVKRIFCLKNDENGCSLAGAVRGAKAATEV